jgi:hypothetical protein
MVGVDGRRSFKFRAVGRDPEPRDSPKQALIDAHQLAIEHPRERHVLRYAALRTVCSRQASVVGWSLADSAHDGPKVPFKVPFRANPT